MDVDAETKDTKTKPQAGQSSAKSASAGATPPTSKSKPKKKAMPKPEKKAMPRVQRTGEVHGPRHNPKKEQFDTSVFTSAQDLAWLEPENMVGIPGRNVEGGRLGAISHAMSDYLRGHRLFYRRPSPDIRRSDLSMDFQSLIRHLQGDFPHLKEQEVLMVVKNSPMRRFRVQASSFSYGTLRWTPVRIRAIQGHRQFLVEQGGMASMVKMMYTFDDTFDVRNIDNPEIHPNFVANPGGSPMGK